MIGAAAGGRWQGQDGKRQGRNGILGKGQRGNNQIPEILLAERYFWGGKAWTFPRPRKVRN